MIERIPATNRIRPVFHVSAAPELCSTLSRQARIPSVWPPYTQNPIKKKAAVAISDNW